MWHNAYSAYQADPYFPSCAFSSVYGQRTGYPHEQRQYGERQHGHLSLTIFNDSKVSVKPVAIQR